MGFMMSAQADIFQLSIQLKVTIRKLRRNDLRKLEWHGEFRHYRRLFLRSYKGQVDGSRLMLIADVNDYPVGRLFVQFYSPRSKVSDGRTKAYLYSFHVMEMFRGQSIGTRLIHAAEAVLRKKKFRLASIAVARENIGALSLYQRQDYVIYGEDKGKWHYQDHRGRVRYVHEPCWLLEKKL